MPEHEPQVGQAERSMICDVLVGDLVVGGGDHGVDQVERDLLAVHDDLAGLHRAAGDEDRRDVEAQRRHQHAGGDLVAIGDADHGVGAMRIDHVFDAVGDDLARRQRIEHAVMAHRDAVIDGDRVELLGDAAGLLDLARDQLAEILQMDMAGHELRERIHHRNDRLAEIAILHARRAPKAAGAGHVAAMGGGAGAIGRHCYPRIGGDWRGDAPSGLWRAGGGKIVSLHQNPKGVEQICRSRRLERPARPSPAYTHRAGSGPLWRCVAHRDVGPLRAPWHGDDWPAR